MKEKRTNEVIDKKLNPETCCILGCENPVTIRNFRSLNAHVGYWKIKNDLQNHYDEDPENSFLKICVDHYNLDLKQFPRAKRKKKYKRKKVAQMQQTVKENNQKKPKKMINIPRKVIDDKFYSILYNLLNEPCLKYPFERSITPTTIYTKLQKEVLYLENNKERYSNFEKKVFNFIDRYEVTLQINKYSLKRVLKPYMFMNTFPLKRNQVQFITHATTENIFWKQDQVLFKDAIIDVKMYFFRAKTIPT
eukprot:gene7146-11459_t